MLDWIDPAVQVLRSGGTILYPTDTIWGIGCDACNAAAVEKIYAIKHRDHAKSMIVLLDSPPGCLPTSPLQEEASYSRPTTFILPLYDNRLSSTDGRQWTLADNLPAADATLGVRVPRHEFCQQLLKAFGNPIVSTSANFSGQPSPLSYDQISADLKAAVDFCVPPLPELLSAESRPSRIIRILADGSQQVLRG